MVSHRGRGLVSAVFGGVGGLQRYRLSFRDLLRLEHRLHLPDGAGGTQGEVLAVARTAARQHLVGRDNRQQRVLLPVRRPQWRLQR